MILDFVRNRIVAAMGDRLVGPASSNGQSGAIAGAGAIAVSDERSAHEVPFREIVAEDFATHDRQLAEPGFWAVALHRLGRRIDHFKPALARRPLAASHKVLVTAVDWVWGINLPRTTRVGRRVRVWHNGSILLDARSIGNDVHIRHDTTFGPARAADRPGPDTRPVIEDGADVGSGACVLGAVTVGKGAIVGANTVVLETVPAGVRVLGVPARVIPNWIAHKK
jgi:serine O-acetyltransferase